MNRPPFILAFAADSQGCGWYRIVLPLAAIVSAGVVEGRLEDKHQSDEWLKAVDPDVVVFQRQTEPAQVESMRRARASLPNSYFIYEIDDLLSAVPTKNHHRGAIPPNTEKQIAEALTLCDACTVTTPLLKTWIEGLGGKNVRVIPNLVPGDKVRPRKVRAENSARKLRIGWAGGMSHAGDLELIKPAMAEIGDAVEWVFFGAKPEGEDAAPIEFHESVLPTEYLDKLYALDVDLFLAPLEMNKFNEAKSSLRMVESGACCGAVIAQDITPYHENSPPVFAHCVTSDDWTREIKRFMALTPKRQAQFGVAMQAWTKSRYTFESRLAERARVWLPSGTDIWSPTQVKPSGKVMTVSDPLKLEVDCARAVKTGDHVLWLRPGATIDEGVKKHLVTGFLGSDPVAAVTPLATDGLNAFPRAGVFTPIDATTAEDIQGAVSEACNGVRLRTSLAFGPCVLMRAEVLNAIGSPNPLAHDGDMDAAMMEWTARAAMRRMHCLQLADIYVGSVTPPMAISQKSKTRLEARGYLQMAGMPSDNLAPQYREQIELGFFRRRWDGLRPGLNDLPDNYPTWSCLKPAFDGVHDPLVVQEVKFGDPIPAAEWIVFTDEKTTLKPGALAKLTDYLRGVTADAQVVYADHEMNDFQGANLIPCFKPDFDLRYFQGHDYVTPVCAVRARYAIDCCSGRESLFAAIVALIGNTDAPPRDVIRHTPEVLATVLDERSRAERTTDLAERAKVKCEQWRLFSDPDKVTFEPHPQLAPLGMLKATYAPVDGLVSIIVPTIGDEELIQTCVNMILQHTTHPDYEVLVVATTDKDPELGAALHDRRVRVLRWKGDFNWSAVNNFAAAQANGSYLCFMNDDVQVARKDWLTNMLSNFQELDVGVVGARLLFPHGPVQHTGVVATDGIVAMIHRNVPPSSPGYQGLAALSHEASAVTGSCMLVKTEIWDKIRFDEKLACNFNDVAFCHRVREAGYRIVAEMQAELHHREGATRAAVEQNAAQRAFQEGVYFREVYGAAPDTYWSPNCEIRIVDGAVVGTSYDRPRWKSRVPPETDYRVLFINDRIGRTKYGLVSKAIIAQQSGMIPLVADLSGTELTLTAPSFAGGVTWDIRNWRNIDRVLRTLGVSEVILCSLSGARFPAAAGDTLRALSHLTTKVGYDPFDAESVCPRRDMLVEGKLCGDGYKQGSAHCQVCIDQHGSPFGQVDVSAWWRSWGDFLAEDSDVADAAD
jgi:GT2 family glycosyltransferase